MASPFPVPPLPGDIGQSAKGHSAGEGFRGKTYEASVLEALDHIRGQGGGGLLVGVALRSLGVEGYLLFHSWVLLV